MARAHSTLLVSCLLFLTVTAIVAQDADEAEDAMSESWDGSAPLGEKDGVMLPLTDKRTKHVRRMMERCNSQRYLRFPVENGSCMGKDCPKLKNEAKSLPPAKSLGCKGERIPNVSVLIIRPSNVTVINTLKKRIPSAWTPEFIAFQDKKQEGKEAMNLHKAMTKELKSDFIVYANAYLGIARPVNRLVKFADAETVVLVQAEHIPMLTEQWLNSAVGALHHHPQLGMVGMHGADGMASPGALEFMDAISPTTAPVVLRRSAFLGAGLIDTSDSCPGDDEKEAKAWQRLGMSMWKHGLAVAALDWEAKSDAAAKAGIPTALAKLGPAAPESNTCPESTKEADRANDACPHGSDKPLTAIVVQYFRRGKNVKGLAKAMRGTSPAGGDVLINDDSMTEHVQWLDALKGVKNAFLVHAPNLHEIRGYNKLSKLSSAEFLGHIQDDDNPVEKDWLLKAVDLFDSYPKLSLIGGRAGRLDTGSKYEVKGRRPIPGYTPGPLYQNDGPKYGMKYTKLSTQDPRTKIPFIFAYKVNASPLVVKRGDFLRLGMYHPAFSCKGESGISFDFEYSVRMWKYDLQVGLYYSYFRDFDNSRSTGTWASAARTKKRMVTWRRNNLQIYYMYPGFHHKVGTQKPVQLNKSKLEKLSCKKGNMKNGRCPNGKSRFGQLSKVTTG